MHKRSSRDVNQMAAAMVRQTEGIDLKGKNPAAVALGRLGGKRGGPARAETLSAERRSAIAKKAAESRWKGKTD